MIRRMTDEGETMRQVIAAGRFGIGLELGLGLDYAIRWWRICDRRGSCDITSFGKIKARG